MDTRSPAKSESDSVSSNGAAESVEIPDRARKRIAACYSRGIAKCTGSTRMPRKPLGELLKQAYGTVAKWRRRDIAKSVMQALRNGAEVHIEVASTQYLTLLRAALPEVDPKKCSKWAAALDAADYHEVRPRDLIDFLEASGGIEGAARERARLWSKVTKGDWARRSPMRKDFLTPSELSPAAKRRHSPRDRSDR